MSRGNASNDMCNLDLHNVSSIHLCSLMNAAHTHTPLNHQVKFVLLSDIGFPTFGCREGGSTTYIFTWIKTC